MKKIHLFLRIVWRKAERSDTFWPHDNRTSLFQYALDGRISAKTAWQVAMRLSRTP